LFTSYGYQPENVIWWALGLAAFGVILRFNTTFRASRSLVRDGEASFSRNKLFTELLSKVPDYFFFSLFTLIPGLTPDNTEEAALGKWSRYYFSSLKIAGYVLALYLGAALSVQLSK
jgi:hypothetical protein